MNHSKLKSHYWKFAFAGYGCLLIGLGINRFAYTPLIPALISQGWLTTSGASYVGAINFLGYFLGAYLGQRATLYFPISKLVKISLIVSIVALALSAINFGYLWFTIWRFILGLTGALLMVLTPSAILKNIPLDFRSRSNGLMFSGIGTGIIISGFFLPYFAMNINISAAWLAGCVIAVFITFFSWSSISKQTPSVSIAIPSEKSDHPREFLLFTIAYSLFAIGVIPHTLFLVDYVHQQLGFNEVTSGLFWVLYGVGAIIGPFFSGFITDEIGIYKSLVGSYIISCIGIIMILFNHITIFYITSSFIMGLILPTIVGLTSARILEIFGAEAHPKFWGKITLYFAISQVIGAYIMSYILHLGYDYTFCFMISAIALICSLIVISFAKNKKNISSSY
ncbi:MAG TPA: YbfB/YjiJ family MFS transporter [Candidatus Saccharimonadales bacterium]|nr:YbfB/YjiJ family MFS transporter [Candidatus Saccharimonadales bacterium]